MFGKLTERFRSFLGVGEGAESQQSRKRQFERTVEDERHVDAPLKRQRKIYVDDSNAQPPIAKKSFSRLLEGFVHTIKSVSDYQYLRNLGESPKRLMKKLTEIGGQSANQRVESSSTSHLSSPEMKGLPLAHSTPHIRPGTGYNFSGVPTELAQRDFQFQKLQTEPMRFRAPAISRAHNGPMVGQRPFNSTRSYPPSNLTPGSRPSQGPARTVYDKKYRTSKIQKNKLASKESIRLDEKRDYAHLLQQYTSFPMPALQSYAGFGRQIYNKKRPSTTETVLGSSVSVMPVKSPAGQTQSSSRDSGPVRITATARPPCIPERSFADLQSRYTENSFKRSQNNLIKQSPSPVKEASTNLTMRTPPGYDRDSPEIIRVVKAKFQPRSPVSLEFEANVKATEWIDTMLQNCSSETRKNDRQVHEEEIKTKHFKEKRDEWELSLERTIRNKLTLSERLPVVLDEDFEVEEEEEEIDEFPELDDEQEREIDNALQPHPQGQVLAEGFRLRLTRQDVNTLKNLNWLNDEVINFYMNLLMERGEKDNFAKVHAFNTFFYPKVMSNGHAGVKRWTKKVDIFAARYILIPVHLGMHWCLAAVDFQRKKISYYDSMGGDNNAGLKAIGQYLVDEKKEKTGEKFSLEGWQLVNEKNIPHQMNGSDCGMFTCKFAEYITRGAEITFTQEHMPYFRRRIVLEIVTKRLL